MPLLADAYQTRGWVLQDFLSLRLGAVFFSLAIFDSCNLRFVESGQALRGVSAPSTAAIFSIVLILAAQPAQGAQ